MKNLCVILFLGLAQWAFGQNDRLYTMFVFNKLQYNPAYAGSKDALHIGTHYRHQWSGVTGAPRTVTAFLHAPFAGNRNGIGLSVISDEIGIFNSTYVNLSYAYRMTFKDKSVLSLGLNAQFDHTRFDWTKASLVDNFDTSIPFEAPASTAINAGVGVYYSAPNYYVGLSAPNFMRNAITSDVYSGFGRVNNFRAYYLMGGAVFELGNKVHVRPSLLVTYVKNAPTEMDLNLSVLFLESFWIGGSYRLGESFDAFLQVPIGKKLKLAAGYDFATTQLNQFTNGSFELMIEYTFKADNEKVNNIRFF